MKYLKTKYNIWEVVGENDKVYRAIGKNGKEYSKSKCQLGEHKISEWALNDLLDACIIKNLKNNTISVWHDIDTVHKYYCGFPKDYKVYGAIWIEKNGKLELKTVSVWNKGWELL